MDDLQKFTTRMEKVRTLVNDLAASEKEPETDEDRELLLSYLPFASNLRLSTESEKRSKVFMYESLFTFMSQL